jgi:DNA-binding NarL/FixJ family response regulator
MNYNQRASMRLVSQGTGESAVHGKRLTDSTRRHIRLLVVDDHPAVQQGLLRLLDDEPDFEVVAVSGTAETAVGVAEHERVDVAVVDYHLGGRNGLWVSRKLKRLPQPPAVIIFSAYANDHLAASCIVAEADAVLNKGSLGSELCDAIRSVARGRRLLARVPQPMADMLRRRLDDSEQPIFGMLLSGISRVEIRQTLGISARELASREGMMLRKLEDLPGEMAAPRRSRNQIDLEKPIPQALPPIPFPR